MRLPRFCRSALLLSLLPALTVRVSAAPADGAADSPSYLIALIALPAALILALAVRRVIAAARDRNTASAVTAQIALRPLRDYAAQHPSFDAAALRRRIRDLYCEMQRCRTARTIEPLRGSLSEALYAEVAASMDAARKAGCTDYVNSLSVRSVRLLGCDEQDHLYAAIRSSAIVYTLADKSAALLAGSRSEKTVSTALWELCATPDGWIVCAMHAPAKKQE